MQLGYQMMYCLTKYDIRVTNVFNPLRHTSYEYKHQNYLLDPENSRINSIIVDFGTFEFENIPNLQNTLFGNIQFSTIV